MACETGRTIRDRGQGNERLNAYVSTACRLRLEQMAKAEAVSYARVIERAINELWMREYRPLGAHPERDEADPAS